PVTGGVANAEQDRFVFGARSRQCLVAPGMPVDRVMSVLQQIRAGLMLQSIGGGCVLDHRSKLLGRRRLCKHPYRFGMMQPSRKRPMAAASCLMPSAKRPVAGFNRGHMR